MLLMGLTTHAQIVTSEGLDETFVFTDLEGNEIADGATIVVSELNDDGQMVIPVKTKNAAGKKAAVSMYEDLSQMPNGGWQTCAFGNCMTLKASGYSAKSIMSADSHAAIDTEWIPATGGYATWEAKLQIHIFNITKKTTFGQTIETAGNEIIGYGPVINVRFEYKDPADQQQTVHQLIMGPHTTDDVAPSESGLGLTGVPGILKIAAVLPVKDFMAFDGGKVTKMRVGLANAAAVSRIFIAKASEEGDVTEVFTQDVSSNAAGWTEYELDTPYTLSLTDCDFLLLGYDYKQTSTQTDGSYPISVISSTLIYPSLMYADFGDGEEWYDVGLSSMGNLSVQAVVESSNFPEKDMVVMALSTNDNYYKAGSELTYSLDLQNFGYGQISSYDFDVKVDDNVVTTFSGSEAIGSQETKSITGKMTLTPDLSNGSHKLALCLKTVDGNAPAANINNDEASTPFMVYAESVPRQKNLIEQFTSQFCTYCPRGVTFFSDLIRQRDDIAWVSIHGNMSGTDIFYNVVNDSIMTYEEVNSYPSASYNRTFVPDMAESDGEIAYGLGYNLTYRTQVVKMLSSTIDYTMQAPSFVTLNIEQVYNPETRALDITVKGDGAEAAAEMLASYGLTVMLTENGIVARQLNEGQWVQNYEHHYVLREVLGKCTGNAINWQGDDFTAHFTYTIPEDYVKDNMYVVAFVAPLIDIFNYDTMNMAINNCEMVAVKDASTTAIMNISADNAAENRFALDGRQLPAAQKGINIVRLADGSVRKVVVK